jgi:hypothetical protein
LLLLENKHVLKLLGIRYGGGLVVPAQRH